MSSLLYHGLTDSCGIADVSLGAPRGREGRQGWEAGRVGGKVGSGAKVIVLGEWYF